MRKFHDIETHEIITEEKLRDEYIQKVKEQPEEFSAMSFAEYLSNSLTCNNGTLEEVHMDQTKREEVIFDASSEIYGVYRDELSDKDIDTRDVFQQIRMFADFWMTAYEPILGTVIPEDAYLEYVTLAALCWIKGFLGHDLTDDDELMLCNNQRVAQYCRENKMTLYDYDCWSTLEEIIGEPMTHEEFHKLNEELPDEPMTLVVCEGNRKDLREKLDKIRYPMERVPVYATVRKFVKAWVEVPCGANRSEIIEQAMQDFMVGKYEEDDGMDTEESDVEIYHIDYDGIQEV